MRELLERRGYYYDREEDEWLKDLNLPNLPKSRVAVARLGRLSVSATDGTRTIGWAVQYGDERGLAEALDVAEETLRKADWVRGWTAAAWQRLQEHPAWKRRWDGRLVRSFGKWKKLYVELDTRSATLGWAELLVWARFGWGRHYREEYWWVERPEDLDRVLAEAERWLEEGPEEAEMPCASK